jgi:hypothetical protein
MINPILAVFLYLGAVLSIVIGVAYVAIHFIVKFW